MAERPSKESIEDLFLQQLIMIRVTYSHLFSLGLVATVVLDFDVQVQTALAAVKLSTLRIGTLRKGM